MEFQTLEPDYPSPMVYEPGMPPPGPPGVDQSMQQQQMQQATSQASSQAAASVASLEEDLKVSKAAVIGIALAIAMTVIGVGVWIGMYWDTILLLYCSFALGMGLTTYGAVQLRYHVLSGRAILADIDEAFYSMMVILGGLSLLLFLFIFATQSVRVLRDRGFAVPRLVMTSSSMPSRSSSLPSFVRGRGKVL